MRRWRQAVRGSRFRAVAAEHSLALLGYSVLAIAVTWPLVRNFDARVIGIGLADVHHSVWMLWHTLEWAQGRQGLFTTRVVFAPSGTNTLTDGVGPLSGFVSLVFWPWGPAAAYNGVVLVGVWLTGYCMYLLARGLSAPPPLAFFAGILFQLTPAHLAGVYGHLEKTFTGFLPLIVLALHYALLPGRSTRWAALTGVLVLAVATYSGYQFVYAALAVAFWSLAALVRAPREDRALVARRLALTAVAVAVLAGPYVFIVANASQGTDVRVNTMSAYYEPDVTQLLLPSFYQETFRFVRPHLGPLHLNSVPYGQPNGWYGPFLETSVTIPLTALVLALIALWRLPRPARAWALFTVSGLILMLGPTLRVHGTTRFTAFELPILLPYAFVDSLPGVEFMRAPGRFGMVTWIGLAVLATAGLARLCARWPRARTAIVVVATIVLLTESWPMPWPQETLPHVPDFYQEIARDPAPYAVLDLPAAFGALPCAGCAPEFASDYQIFQMTHHKAIAWGYFSHNDPHHPLPIIDYLLTFGVAPLSEVRVDGTPTPPLADAQAELAHAGYRYVVWHTTLYRKILGKDDPTTAALVDAIFGKNARPIHTDNLTQVYQIVPNLQSSTTLRTGVNWHPGNLGELWATSPATLVTSVPHATAAELTLTPTAMHDPRSASGLGTTGVLNVRVGERVVAVPITAGQPVTIPLTVDAGNQTITLSLQAGNFRPSDYSGMDASVLSFAVSEVDLRPTPP